MCPGQRVSKNFVSGFEFFQKTSQMATPLGIGPETEDMSCREKQRAASSAKEPLQAPVLWATRVASA